MSSEDNIVNWEFSKEERAEMALTLQEAYIEYWHQTEEPHSLEFLEFVRDNGGIGGWELINETFGSYSGLVRSLGETPRNKRTPQDALEDVFRSNIDMPATYSELSEEGHHSISGLCQSHLGSYSVMIEALGLFDEYEQKVKDRQVAKSPEFEEVLDKRDRDLHSLVSHLETKKGKKYGSFEAKYTVK